VVELTVALHYVFDSPRDKIVWDVGHQSYPHKILTGRNDWMDDLRQADGPSGFCRIVESEHDVFGAGHASTSISAGLGVAVARDLQGETFKVVTVTGDGAMTAGLAYEGLNNAGAMESDLLVILNDNQMSIAPNVGSMHKYLTRVVTDPLYNRLKDEVWDLTGRIPRLSDEVRAVAHKLEEGLKGFLTPGLLFEELGFRYFGPIDGHDIDLLIDTLERLKDLKGPRLLHVLTVKGKGYPFAEANQWKYHGVGAINLESGKVEGPPSPPKWTKVFGNALVEIGRKNEKVCAITAAMPDGAGVQGFLEAFAASTWGSPSSMRCALRRVSRGREWSLSAPSTRLSSSELMTRWSTTSASRSFRSCSCWTVRVSSARTDPRTWGPTMSHTCRPSPT
jgi:1-deoxy-D-xylulose-5-phosphate synthase